MIVAVAVLCAGLFVLGVILTVRAWEAEQWAKSLVRYPPLTAPPLEREGCRRVLDAARFAHHPTTLLPAASLADHA